MTNAGARHSAPKYCKWTLRQTTGVCYTRIYVLGAPSHFPTEYRHEAAVVSREHRMKWVVVLGDGYQWPLPWECTKSTGHIGCFWCKLCSTGTYVKRGILGMQFYIYVVKFMCGQIQQIQGIWCEFGRVFLLIYCTFHVFIKCSNYVLLAGHLC